jgi:NADH-quinone oxidoreductase subunit L
MCFLFTSKEDSFIFLRFDGLGTLLSSYILLVSLVIHKYSENYMKDEQGLKRYFILLDLMTWNLLTLVLSNHLLVLFSSWHLMGVILYFLLAFNNRRGQAVESGRLALFTHRLADVPLLIAVLLLYKQYGTFEISKLAQAITTGSSDTLWIPTLLIVLSGILKSAQIPFHVWLVYSMEGPTPVSALMHAGIVNAGAIIASKFSFLFAYDLYGLSLSFLVGIITAGVGLHPYADAERCKEGVGIFHRRADGLYDDGSGRGCLCPCHISHDGSRHIQGYPVSLLGWCYTRSKERTPTFQGTRFTTH